MNVDDYFPFDEYRPYQREAILKIIELIEAGTTNVILNAPVGSGKSVIAYTVAQYFWHKIFAKSFIMTSTKFLQDQYLDDFKDLKTVKGRNNFRCISDCSQTCDKGSCKTMSNIQCQYGVTIGDYGSLELKPVDEGEENCPYWTQKIEAIEAPISILNYKFALTDKAYVQHFPHRQLAIFDEAHNIEEEIMSFMEIMIAPGQIKKDLGYTIENFMTDSILTWSDELSQIASTYKTSADSVMLTQEQKNRFLERSKTLAIASKWFKNDPGNWVIVRKEDNIIFKPVLVNKYSQRYLLGVGQQHLFMSGSILKEDTYAESLGLTDYEVVTIPSTVPAKNRPIIKDYVGSMSSRNVDTTIDKMVDEILEIAKKYPNEKGVIHTYTYKISYMLRERIHDSRFMFHSSKNREAKTYEFKQKEDNTIFVSAHSFEGVDFKDDESRFQIIVKAPFPNVFDPQIKKRDQVSNFKWLYEKRCKILSQMYGRSIRSMEDYATTYLLDSEIEKLLGDASLVTTYFWEGLLDDMANKEITVVDVTKLSKNKRKSYANARSNEKNILEAIQEEKLYTLTALRGAYKKLKGDSYKVVTPTFKKLLKNGAIKFIGEENEER